MTNDSYTIQEAADRLGVSTSTIYSYEKRKLLVRIEDPHRLFRGIRFPKGAVEQLKREKEYRESAGRSVTEVANRLGVYPGKVNDAIITLQLNVSMIRSGLSENSYRYAISSEQETEISDYIKQQKTTRPKRNHLFQPKEDLALYQSFLIAGEQPIRLKQKNGTGAFGFYLENELFIPYIDALRFYDLEPRYSIHQSKTTSAKGFTDLVIPIGKRPFTNCLISSMPFVALKTSMRRFETGICLHPSEMALTQSITLRQTKYWHSCVGTLNRERSKQQRIHGSSCGRKNPF